MMVKILFTSRRMCACVLKGGREGGGQILQWATLCRFFIWSVGGDYRPQKIVLVRLPGLADSSPATPFSGQPTQPLRTRASPPAHIVAKSSTKVMGAVVAWLCLSSWIHHQGISAIVRLGGFFFIFQLEVFNISWFIQVLTIIFTRLTLKSMHLYQLKSLCWQAFYFSVSLQF